MPLAFILLCFQFLFGQSGAEVPADSARTPDSNRVSILGIKPNYLQMVPFTLTGDSLHLQFNFQQRYLHKIPPDIIDLNEVMPQNRLFLDYRQSSYYTPWYVKEELAKIMDRPTPNEVWPIYTVALIAAKLALKKMEILKKISIKPQDYLIPRKYWPILKALWTKAPQTVTELYRIREIQQGRTLEILKKDLQFLVDRKLVKPKTVPKAPTEYFPAQTRGQAIELLDKALQNDRYSLMNKKRWQELRHYIVGDDQ